MKKKNLQMSLKTFTKLIEGAKKYDEKISKLHGLGVDLLSLNDDYYRDVVKPLMEEAFGKGNIEMLDWFMYERKEEWGREAATDKDGNPICYDIPSLYEYVTKP